MINEVNNDINNNNVLVDNNTGVVETQYVDEFGNPIDPSLIDENGNYIGETITQYVDEFGNPIDPSLIDENGNYIGAPTTNYIDEAGNPIPESVQTNTINENELANALNQASDIEILEPSNNNEVAQVQSASAKQMENKELLSGMVTFDYNNVPITDIVNSIILDAINKGASDIHFDPFDDGIKIRLRVDGQLNDYSIVPLYVKKNMITRIKIISGMNITESRVPQDGAIRTELQNKTIDLRVSCLPTNMGEKIVVRIMDYSMSAQGIEALDFSEENLEKIRKMLALPNGIILVTGATGSGKSTTVYSMLQKLNIEGTNLVTVEDPIEMNIGGINQVQAVSEIGLTFATVLRSILRQDPDVIMIGEIRDDETARIAVRASITGHLVLSTIHTNNSLSTIERLTDMSVERYLLGSSLSGIVSQKLSRRLCEKCKRIRPTTEYEKDIFQKTLHKDVLEIYEPVGCPECSRGYRGRIAIHEVLLLNQQIKDAITQGVNKSVLRNLVYSNNGTDTMLQDGLNKVLEGKTSFEEILKLVDLEDDLGSGTQLGLDEQLDASNMNLNGESNVVPQAININITPDMLQNANFQMPAMNINPNMAQPMYVPYPVAMEDDEDDEPEVIIKPKRKKRKKKTIVEIDPDELFDEEIVTKIKKDKKNDEIQELDEEEIIESLDNLEEHEVIESLEDNQEIEKMDETEIEENNENQLEIENLEELEVIDKLDNSQELESDQESPTLSDNIEKKNNSKKDKQKNKAENKLRDLTDKMNNLLERLHATKKIKGKKKYNIKIQELLNEIEPLYKEIKKLDDKYEFNNQTEDDIKKLLEGTILNIDLLGKDENISLYKKTKVRIKETIASFTANAHKDEIKEVIYKDDEVQDADTQFDEVIKMMDENFPEEVIDFSELDEPISIIEDVPSLNIVEDNSYDEILEDEIEKQIPISIDDNTPELNIVEDENYGLEPLSIEEDYEQLELVSTDDISFDNLEENADAIEDDKIMELFDNIDLIKEIPTHEEVLELDESDSFKNDDSVIDTLLDDLDDIEEM